MDCAEISVVPVVPSEIQPLISPHSPLALYSRSLRKKLATCIQCHICLLSAAYATVMNAAVFSGYVIGSGSVSSAITIAYSFLAFMTLFSPLSGFLADVCWGRYRVIVASILLESCASLMWSIWSILALKYGSKVWHVHHSVLGPLSFTLLGIAFVVFVTGLAGYQANFIQFGLDQLLEVPSTSLALFIHWVIWADSLGTLVTQVFFAVLLCKLESKHVYVPLCVWAILLMLFFFLITLCFRRRWFYIEPGQYCNNPYKMVVKVLYYTRKHKYPLQRSAFTYCDDERPSRIDFAKERYGGPFTTEQVEDVKTFFRILFVLISIGPVFVLETPASFFMSIVFGVHTGHHSFRQNQTCDGRKGSMISLVTVLLFPVYTWIMFSALRRRVPRFFVRLVLSVVFYLLGVASMLCIDFAGHLKARGDTTENRTMCMFAVDHVLQQPILRLHLAVLLIPSLLLGIGPPLVMTTTFEFISAQSPSSMKGLLVGVFFTVRAVFQLISGAALIPFAYRPLWNRHHMIEHPPVTNCGFGYLLFTCIVALIGLVLLSVVAKRYKYRERDDRPYDQRLAVDVYGHYIEQALENIIY